MVKIYTRFQTKTKAKLWIITGQTEAKHNTNNMCINIAISLSYFADHVVDFTADEDSGNEEV